MIPRANGIDQVMLVEGAQEIPTHQWFEARNYVSDKIADGVIEEEWTKKNSGDKEIDFKFSIVDPDDPKQILVPMILKDRNKNEARKVVEKCSHVPTLMKWNMEELRPEVSLAILNQLKKYDKQSGKDYKGMEQGVLDNYGAKR
jgi:hypothetical protein